MARWYHIEVSVAGSVIAEYTVEAPDALTAINQVEAQYGPPPSVEIKNSNTESGAKEHSLVVLAWHGYSFQAREIK